VLTYLTCSFSSIYERSSGPAFIQVNIAHFNSRRGSESGKGRNENKSERVRSESGSARASASASASRMLVDESAKM